MNYNNNNNDNNNNNNNNGIIQDDLEDVPVSSENFEFWIRMATDNKINTNNTWNVALIDYFHDFTILKEGDGVNFQKASATLDGCMKIYSHRIDSAAKDTGTLLNYLNIKSNNSSNTLDNSNINNAKTNSNNDISDDDIDGSGDEDRTDESDEDSGDDDEEDDNDDDNDFNENNNNSDQQVETKTIVGNTTSHKKRKSKKKKKKSKSKKAKVVKTLANSFNSIKIKDSDRPVKTDPVFKNALAIFDEGGAKSLLNNFLRISKYSKVEFDIADDKPIITDESLMDEKRTSEIDQYMMNDSIDINELKSFVNFDIINQSLDICPSIKELQSISDGNNDPTNLLESLNNFDVTEIEESQLNRLKNNHIGYENNLDNNGDNEIPDFDFDVDMNMNDDDDNLNNNGADAASNVSKRTQYSLFMDGPENPDESDHNITFTNNLDQRSKGDHHKLENAMDSKASGKNYLEMMKLYDDIGSRPNIYWKITRLKRNTNKTYEDITKEQAEYDANEDSTHQKNKKSYKKYRRRSDAIFIDFLSDSEDLNENELFESTEYLSRTFLSEKERKSGRHLLSSDSSFTVKKLAFLNIKPNQLIKTLFGSNTMAQSYEDRYLNNIPADQGYFAHVYDERSKNNNNHEDKDDGDDEFRKNTFDNDILSDSILSDAMNQSFNDDFDPNGIEGFDVPLSDPFASPTKKNIFSTQSLYRTNAISYAKRSKKVDVKLLKQNIWNSIEEISTHKKKRAASHFDDDDDDNGNELNVVNDQKKREDGKPVTNDETPTEESLRSEISNFTNRTASTTLENLIDEKEGIDEMHFTKVVELMSSKYNNIKTKKDLSTSFCFICLLHLANEQGLTLETLNNHEDIIIHK